MTPAKRRAEAERNRKGFNRLLSAVRLCKPGWYLDRGRIRHRCLEAVPFRNDPPMPCNILAAPLVGAGEPVGNTTFGLLRDGFGFTNAFTVLVIDAADDPDHSPPVRRALLEACGLEDTANGK